MAVLIVMAVQGAGYFVTIWAPWTLFLLGLLVVAVLTLPLRLAEVPVPVRIAFFGLTAFTAWSFLSIAWAGARADAWEAANRTLLYLVVFALFALWPQRGRATALVLGAWTIAMTIAAAVVLIGIAGAAHPLDGFISGRQVRLAGYDNAAAVMWLMPVWPAIVLAAHRELPWWLRGVLAGGAVGLVDLALLSQSRGSLYAVPVVLVVLFVVVPGRVRALMVLLPVAAAVAATAPAALHVFEPTASGHPAHASQLPGVIGSFGLAALAAGLVVAAVSAFERYRPPSRVVARRLHAAAAAGAVTALIAAIVVALALVGSPSARAHDAWRSFKGGYTTQTQATRLTNGLGSNRYDFYRVALDRFGAHPWNGIGAENFAQDYLRMGRSDETPRYAHSFELAVLSGTGIVGAVLLLLALAAALVAAATAIRRGEQLARHVASGAALVFVYFLVHGSVDWFWEFAGIGAPAFAMLGLGCALCPRASRPNGLAPVRTPVVRGVPAATAMTLACLVPAASLALPWISEAEVGRATSTWRIGAAAAYRSLDRAATLNPLSDRPRLIEGTIALRLKDTARARQAFTQALERNSRGQYATLELGAIASASGQRSSAIRLLSRAVALAPRYEIARAALGAVRRNKQVDVAALNARILAQAAALTR